MSHSEWPRVSEIIKAAGLVNADFFTEYAREKGSAVHKACELHDAGTLDFASVDPAIAGRLASYRIFLAEMRPEILRAEVPLQHRVYQFRGTPDRIVQIGSKEGVLDIKPPGRYHWHAIQTAGYALLADVRFRWTLHLSDDGGRPTLIEHTDRTDRAVFLAALTVTNWKRKHALAEREDAA